jgi:hypothetical protein
MSTALSRSMAACPLHRPVLSPRCSLISRTIVTGVRRPSTEAVRVTPPRSSYTDRFSFNALAGFPLWSLTERKMKPIPLTSTSCRPSWRCRSRWLGESGPVKRARSVLLFLLFLQHHHALRFTGIEVGLRNFLMHQVLVAIDAGGPLRFHLLVGGFGRRTRRLGILVALPAGRCPNSSATCVRSGP